jgi:hypothetical protein
MKAVVLLCALLLWSCDKEPEVAAARPTLKERLDAKKKEREAEPKSDSVDVALASLGDSLALAQFSEALKQRFELAKEIQDLRAQIRKKGSATEEMKQSLQRIMANDAVFARKLMEGRIGIEKTRARSANPELIDRALRAYEGNEIYIAACYALEDLYDDMATRSATSGDAERIRNLVAEMKRGAAVWSEK